MTYKIYSRLYESAKNCRDLESFIANNPSIHPDDLKAIYLFASNPIKSSISAANMSQRDFAAEYGIPLRSIENWSRGASEPPTYLQQLITYAVFTNQRSVSKMNVLNKMEEIYGSELSLAAVQLCNDEDADIIKSYQSSWDARRILYPGRHERPLFRPSRRRFGGGNHRLCGCFVSSSDPGRQKALGFRPVEKRSRDTLQHSSQCPWWKRRLYNLQGCPCVLLRPRGSLELRPSQRRANRISSREYHLKEVKT